jgi:hypothetical protein
VDSVSPFRHPFKLKRGNAVFYDCYNPASEVLVQRKESGSGWQEQDLLFGVLTQMDYSPDTHEQVNKHRSFDSECNPTGSPHRYLIAYIGSVDPAPVRFQASIWIDWNLFGTIGNGETSGRAWCGVRNAVWNHSDDHSCDIQRDKWDWEHERIACRRGRKSLLRRDGRLSRRCPRPSILKSPRPHQLETLRRS